MLEFNPFMRPTVEECLSHPYFEVIRNPTVLSFSPRVIDILIDHDNQNLNLADLKAIIVQEINFFKLKRIQDGPDHINKIYCP
jgi:serine/threonine protein kinase